MHWLSSKIATVRSNNKYSKIAIILGAIILFGILFVFAKRTIGSDDTVFPVQILPYHTLFKWLDYRYHNWSGRIFAESFVYIFSPRSLNYWKFVSIVAYVISGWFAFLYYKLYSSDTKLDKHMLALAMALPLLMETSVLWNGMFWITGGMCYFWISCFAIMGLYPVFFYLKNRYFPKLVYSIGGLLSLAVAASSQEQVAFILVAITSIVLLRTAYVYLKNRQINNNRFPAWLLTYWVVVVASFLISVLAPGNRVRAASELSTWLPSFYTTPITAHIEYAYRWALDAFLNHSGFLLAGLWLCLSLLIIKKPLKKALDYSLFGVLLISTILLINKGSQQFGVWLDFHNAWGIGLQSPLEYLPLLIWIAPIIASLLAPFVIFGRTWKGYLYSGLFALFMASASLMLLSPTMYASGWRTLFVPSLALSYSFYLLVYETARKYFSKRYLMFSIVFIIALFQYIFIFAKLI